MNYPINKTYVFGAIAVALALVFVVGLTGAHSAQACNSGCGTYYPQTSPLQVQCYPQPLTINVGDSSTWISNVYGGTGSYSYSWSGTDGLAASGPSFSKVYYSPGQKNATLTVTSGNQTQSVSCSGSVTVYGNNNYQNPPVYNPPTYYPPTNYYYPPQVSCTPNVTYTNVGTTVTWSASVSGGYNSYNNGYNNNYYYYAPNYSWSGTDGLYGYGQSVAMTYNTPGYKTASVTVTVNGQTTTQICANSVNVSGYAYNYGYNYGYNYNYNYNTNVNSNDNGLNIGCYPDPSTASLNQPVSWAVEVTGGVGPYTYSWSGTDGLTGSASSLVKYYNSYGEKSAVVSVTSADGKTGTRACSNTVNVRRSGGTYTPPAQTTAPAATSTQQNGYNNQSAAALFSLQNVPWGWIAILIILILFATIMYLIFNRPKI
jgi:hypothetical protein